MFNPSSQTNWRSERYHINLLIFIYKTNFFSNSQVLSCKRTFVLLISLTQNPKMSTALLLSTMWVKTYLQYLSNFSVTRRLKVMQIYFIEWSEEQWDGTSLAELVPCWQNCERYHRHRVGGGCRGACRGHKLHWSAAYTCKWKPWKYQGVLNYLSSVLYFKILCLEKILNYFYMSTIDTSNYCARRIWCIEFPTKCQLSSSVNGDQITN